MPRPSEREAMADEEKFLQENCRQLKDQKNLQLLFSICYTLKSTVIKYRERTLLKSGILFYN